MPPLWLLHVLPSAEGIETELQQPLRFSLLLGDESHRVLCEATVDDFSLYVCGKAIGVCLLGYLLDYVVGHRHGLRP